MTRLSLLLIVAVLLSTGASVGCYTVLRHPPAHDMTGQIERDRTCFDCHADSDYYHWSDPYYTQSSLYYPSPWAPYYGQAWWYDPHGPENHEVESGAPVSDRHAWERSSGPPDIPRVGGGVRANPAPPAPPILVDPSPSQSESSGGQTSDEKPKPQRKKSKPEKKRHSWKR